MALSEAYKIEFFYGKQYHGERPSVFRDIYQNILPLFIKTHDISELPLQRSLNHEPMSLHRDYWLKDLDYHVRYGIVIYFNDDYEGGEIQYPEVGLVHKPKARSLVMHGGNILHGPKQVIGSKVRYFSTTFVKEKNTGGVILNPELFGDVELHDGSSYP